MTPFLNYQIVKYQTTCIDQSVCDRLIRAPIIKGTFPQSLFTLSIFLLHSIFHINITIVLYFMFLSTVIITHSSGTIKGMQMGNITVIELMFMLLSEERERQRTKASRCFLPAYRITVFQCVAEGSKVQYCENA